ncbi:MAG: hypothetical protein ACTHXO_08110 [Actinomycetaceae bacterium]
MTSSRITLLPAAGLAIGLLLSGCSGLSEQLPRGRHELPTDQQAGAASGDETGGTGEEAASQDPGDVGGSDSPGDDAAGEDAVDDSGAADEGADDAGTAADPVTIRMTWPDQWLEQPADSLPPGSVAMARTLPDGVAAATVVTYEAGGAAADVPALLEGRGADPASITTGEPRDVAGAATERWQARSVSGEFDMVAYPVPTPGGGTSLVTFVVTAGAADQIEPDIAEVLDSYEIG